MPLIGAALDSGPLITYDGEHVAPGRKPAHIPLALRQPRRQRARLLLPRTIAAGPRSRNTAAATTSSSCAAACSASTLAGAA